MLKSLVVGRAVKVGDKTWLYEREIPSEDPSTEYVIIATDICPAKKGDLVFYEPYSSNMGVFQFILM